MLHTAKTDPELRDWLRFQTENGSGFLRAAAEVAMTAEVGEFNLLRPTLVALRAGSPEPNSTVVTVITDFYRVTYNDMETVDNVTCVFNRFNGTVFNNELPETKIRWASSIQSLRAPGIPVGLLALPTDPVTHALSTQRRLTTPHIFLTEKLKGISPLDEWVLLHEMCHFKVPNHGEDFIKELKRVLDKINWSVLLGGY